jgi:hypothetical protein
MSIVAGSLFVPKPLHAPSCNHSDIADDPYKRLRLALFSFMLAMEEQLIIFHLEKKFP